ncbi:hypothetical protein ACU3L3_06805 [Priestia endophytica]
MAKKKQFSPAMLTEEYNIYKETVDIPVYVGDEEITIKLTPYFSPDSITEMLVEMQNFYQKAEEEKLEVNDLEKEELIGCFIMKKYTDMKFTRSQKAKTLFEEFKKLKNSMLYKEFITELIPKESINKVYETIFKMYEMVAENEAMLQEKITEIHEQMQGLPLENREIIENIFKKAAEKNE